MSANINAVVGAKININIF